MTDARSPISRPDATVASPEAAPRPDPVTVLVEVRFKRERQAAALAELRATIERRAHEPGYLYATVLRDPVDSARFLILETFASAQALQIHEALPSTHEFLGRMQPHLAAPPSRTTWHTMWRAASRP
jgi:quinol monooxygenase YgiN